MDEKGSAAEPKKAKDVAMSRFSVVTVALLLTGAMAISGLSATAKTSNCGKVTAGGTKGAKVTVQVVSGKLSCKKAKSVMGEWASGPSSVPTKIKGFTCSIAANNKDLLCVKGSVKVKAKS